MIRYLNILINIIDKYQKLAMIVLFAIVVGAYAIAAINGGVNPDKVYYIGSAQAIAEGLTPFTDYKIGYTPLAFYAMSLPVKWFGTSLQSAMIVITVVMAIDAVLVYLISKKLTEEKFLSLFAALSFLLLSYAFSATAYMLEPFVLITGLLSIYTLLKEKKRWLFLAGFFAFAAYWTKQYGIGFIALLSAYILVKGGINKPTISKLVITWAGFVVGACLFIGIMLAQGVTLHDMCGLSGASYDREGVSSLLLGFMSILRNYSVVLLSFVLVLMSGIKGLKHPFFWICVFGIGGFTLQTYFRLYGHYLILATPFCVLLVVHCMKNLTDKKYLVIIKSWTLVCTLLLFAKVILMMNAICHSTKRYELQNTVEKISKVIPQGSKNVYALGTINMLASSELGCMPPLMREHGFSSGYEHIDRYFEETLAEADYVIIDKKYLVKYSKYVTSFDINTKFNQMVLSNDSLLVMTKR